MAMSGRGIGLAALLTAVGVSPALADDSASQGNYNGACGSVTYTATQRPQPMTVDANGNLCVSQSSAPPPSIGVVPVVSTALEGSHVLKGGAGLLYGAYASNFTGGTTGNLLIFNATSAPADGAVAPLVCLPFNSSTLVGIDYSLAAASFSTGITAVISSAASCFTKTTGVITGFISGRVSP